MMQDSDEIQRIRDATDIFLRLRDNPEDPKLLRERESFLARGEEERLAYHKMLQVWSVTGTAKRAKRPGVASLALAGAVLVAGYVTFQANRHILIADVYTQYDTQALHLDSGDYLALDARSAFVDKSDAHERHVHLLQGAAFFDVETESRPFVVTAGDVRVQVTGTAFEVTGDENSGMVSVAEGAVNVVIENASWQLRPGDRLVWSDDVGARLTKFDASQTASWRNDVLISDDMTFEQIVDVLDRRMPGQLIVTDATLADTKIVGSFDLSDPQQSLDLVVELMGAKVISMPYVVSVIAKR